MVDKVHNDYLAGQFVTASLTHFTLGLAGMAASDLEHVYKTLATRATTVIIGAIAGDEVRVAVENNGAWDAAGLEAALGGAWTAADFAY